VSQESKLVPSAWNILMLSVRIHVQNKGTQENSSMGQGVRSQGKKEIRLAPTKFSKGSVRTT
jgi:hypothetical protein